MSNIVMWGKIPGTLVSRDEQKASFLWKIACSGRDIKGIEIDFECTGRWVNVPIAEINEERRVVSAWILYWDPDEEAEKKTAVGEVYHGIVLEMYKDEITKARLQDANVEQLKERLKNRHQETQAIQAV